MGPGRFRTQVFERPDALLAHHAEEPADAIITDLVMPDLDGVEVTRRLRSGDRHVPIVLSGGLNPDNVGRAIAAVHPFAVDTAFNTKLLDTAVKMDASKVSK